MTSRRKDDIQGQDEMEEELTLIPMTTRTVIVASIRWSLNVHMWLPLNIAVWTGYLDFVLYVLLI